MLQPLLTRWRALNEWLRALLLAVVVLAFAHIFLLRFVSVRSTSMYATLLPGDLVAVTRWNAWTGFDRGDIAVFRDPVQDDRAMLQRQLLIKRIVGLPGDTVRLIDGRLFVNGRHTDPIPGETRSHLVRLKEGIDHRSLLNSLGLPSDFAPDDRSFVELPLNKTLAKSISDRDDVLSAEPMSTATGAPRHIFPYSPAYAWNTDDYGPIIVPKRGDTLRINPMNIALYDRLISRYEQHAISNHGNDLMIDGVITDRYVVEQDHFFVLGDCRHYSSDSRFWGFVPADHLVGRAAWIMIPSPSGDAIGARAFTGL